MSKREEDDFYWLASAIEEGSSEHYIQDCWQRADVLARNLAFGLACVACPAAHERCDESGPSHACGYSFYCTLASLVLDRAGLWAERGGV